MIHKIKTILVAIICILTVGSAFGKVTVTAKLDSVNLLMGNITTLGLEVVQDKGKPGGFPMFKDADPALGYVGICGDSIELRTSYKADTVEIGSGRIQINYKVPVQAFDSGTFRLPQFVYVSESDTARSNVLTLNVVPVNVTADDPIAGFAPVAEPEGKKITDILPNWLSDYWWVILLVVLLAGAAIWAMRRYKKEGTVLPKKPQPTPYETAMRDLRELKTKNLWEQGLEKEYFTRLTDILRTYLDRRFGINAMEMTTREIMDHLYESDIKDKREYMRQILSVADFVKFAKVRPLPADNIAAYENAVKFVEETKPVAPAPDENTGDNGLKPGDVKPGDVKTAEVKTGATGVKKAAEMKKGGEK
ncbi:MAG: YpfN family protein [Muribaculaceae bacterium]|nr:YpfN family protein [Muribaculaceae bacterium]